MWEVERCWASMTSISDNESTFLRFIQLKSLGPRSGRRMSAGSGGWPGRAGGVDNAEGAVLWEVDAFFAKSPAPPALADDPVHSPDLSAAFIAQANSSQSNSPSSSTP